MTKLKKYIIKSERPTTPPSSLSEVFYYTSDSEYFPFEGMESIPAEEANKLFMMRRLVKVKEGNPSVYRILPEGAFSWTEMVGIVTGKTSIQDEVLNSRGDGFMPLVGKVNPLVWLEDNLDRLKGLRIRIVVEVLPDQEVNKWGKIYLEANKQYKDFTALKPVPLADGKAKVSFVTYTSDRYNLGYNMINRHYDVMLKINDTIIDPPIGEDGRILSKSQDFVNYVERTGISADTLKDIIRQAEEVRKSVKNTLHLGGLSWVSEEFFTQLTNERRPNVEVKVIE